MNAQPKVRLSKRLYTTREAAEYLGCSIWTLREIVWKGLLPSVRLGGRIKLDVRDLEAFVEKSKTVETAP